MTAYAVIGANYGDEGKGLITDYLCRRENADLVVRFNGGAQAGHTVVTPEGVRHVFSHFGSGTLAGVPTFLSRFFVCNPALFVAELMRLPKSPKISVDCRCLVTTPWDMILNQAVEKARGNGRHGSCGVGFGETIERSEWFDPLRVEHLSCRDDIRVRLHLIQTRWVPIRARELGLPSIPTYDPAITERFLDDCDRFIRVCEVNQREDALRAAKRIVFEGAQGLKLDMENGDFPHVTRSRTGMWNVLELTAGRITVDPVYVTRAYLTRHGAGPIDGKEIEFPKHISDTTNIDHEFQGALRYAPFDDDSWVRMNNRIKRDVRNASHFPSIAVTWGDCENVRKTDQVKIVSYGRTASDVYQRSSV